MIKTDKEYQECLQKLDEDVEFIEQQKQLLAKTGLSEEEIETALEPNSLFTSNSKMRNSGTSVPKGGILAYSKTSPTSDEL